MTDELDKNLLIQALNNDDNERGMELSKKNLESICAKLSISKSGTKQELVNRLKQKGHIF